MDVYFIIGNNVDLSKYDFTNKVVVGIDRGAYLAYLANIKLECAVGDFDSISANELKELEDYTKIIKLNPIKDDTDTLHALNLYAHCDNLYLLGGISGSRIDHFVANLKLFYQFPNLKIIDNDTVIMRCETGVNFQKDEYTYYSFFALDDVYNLTLEGFKYPLKNYTLLESSSVGVSNEIVNFEGKVSYSSGKLLLIKTKK